MKHMTMAPAKQLPKGIRVCNTIRDLIVVAILDWGGSGMIASEIASEYEWIVGEAVDNYTMYPVLRRLRAKGWAEQLKPGKWDSRVMKSHVATPRGLNAIRLMRNIFNEVPALKRVA